MATLTKRQKQLVDFLENYITEHGYAPTLERGRPVFRALVTRDGA